MTKLAYLCETGLLRINGQDAKKLLQGQLTCQMDDITPSHSQIAAHCNPQGRVISLFYIFLLQEAYYLLMSRAMIPIAMQALKKYAVFYQTELTDVSNEFSILGAMGSLSTIPSHSDYSLITPPKSSNRVIIVGPLTTMTSHLQPLKNTATELTTEQWKQMDFEDKIPTIYPNTSGVFLPHDLNLADLNAIHFDKGCYTGQEIIARMHYRGKIKNHLYQATITGATQTLPGADIYSNQAQERSICGKIVDVCSVKNGHFDALILTDENHAARAHLFLKDDGHLLIKTTQ